MSLLFWRKTKNTEQYRPDGIAQTKHVEVDESNPLPIQIVTNDDEDPPKFQLEQEYLPPVPGVTIERKVQIPGIGTASAYTAGDAFGTSITIPDVFRSGIHTGVLTKLVLHDLDDEGIQKDVILFDRPITTTADNAAYAPSDIDVLACQGGESIITFFNWSNNQIGQWTGTHWVKSLDRHLYIRLVTGGADNIAAGAVPWLSVCVVPD